MGQSGKDIEKRLSAIEKQLKQILKFEGDLERRVKFVEERGKVLADSLTKGKDLEKLLEVHQRKMMREFEQGQKDSWERQKATERRLDIREKREQAFERENQKEHEKNRKEAEKYADEQWKQWEKQRLDTRLATLEATVAALQKRSGN